MEILPDDYSSLDDYEENRSELVPFITVPSPTLGPMTPAAAGVTIGLNCSLQIGITATTVVGIGFMAWGIYQTLKRRSVQKKYSRSIVDPVRVETGVKTSIPVEKNTSQMTEMTEIPSKTATLKKKSPSKKKITSAVIHETRSGDKSLTPVQKNLKRTTSETLETPISTLASRKIKTRKINSEPSGRTKQKLAISKPLSVSKIPTPLNFENEPQTIPDPQIPEELAPEDPTADFFRPRAVEEDMDIVVNEGDPLEAYHGGPAQFYGK